MRDIALRNGPLDWNAGKNEKRSADVTGSGRHFCDGELNSTGYEEKRLETNHWKILHSAKDLGAGIGIEFLRVIFIR